MAEVVAPRGKRARSPSPAYGGDTLASPLEVLLKRRRRGEWSAVGGSNNGAAAGANGSGVGGISTSGGGMFVPPPPPVWRPDPYAGGRGGHQHNNGGGSRDEGEMDHDASSSVAAMSSPLRHRRDDDDDMAESSTAWMRRAGIERRRQRAWEYLQNPTASAPGTASNASSSTATTGDATAMTQAPVSYMYSLSQPQGRIDSSPAAPSRYSRAHSASLPPPAAAQTPEPVAGAVSSSPVRHEPPSSTPFRGGSGDLDVWTEDERMREWGEEYSAQNSILYSLHRARVDSASDPPTPASDLFIPHQQAFTTQTHTTPNSHPYGHLPTPYRYAQRTPLETPGLVSSPYESSPIPFSPATAPPAGPMPSPAHGGHGGRFQHEHAAVRAGYEEANRLLASLNVARLRRQRDEGVAGGEVGEGETGNAGGDSGHHTRTRMDVMDEHW